MRRHLRGYEGKRLRVPPEALREPQYSLLVRFHLSLNSRRRGQFGNLSSLFEPSPNIRTGANLASRDGLDDHLMLAPLSSGLDEGQVEVAVDSDLLSWTFKLSNLPTFFSVVFPHL